MKQQPAILLAAMVASAFGVVLLYDTFRTKPQPAPAPESSPPMFNTEPEVIQVLGPYGIKPLTQQA